MAKVAVMKSIHVVPPDGETLNPVMSSLCRSVAMVNAIAFFLESLEPAEHMHDRAKKEAFIARGISVLALNVHEITGAEAEQTRTDVQVLANALGIDLYNVPGDSAEGQVH